VAILKGEGRVPILFGTWVLAVPPNRSAYIARPDLEGEYATVIVAHDQNGVTPGVRAIARYLARHGYSVMVPDLTRGSRSGGGEFEWVVSDLTDAVDTARIPGTRWASDSRIAMIGVGVGGIAASIVAAEEAAVGVLVLAGAVLDADLLSESDAALLVLQGARDEMAPADEVRDMQQAVGRGEWVLYSGVGLGFLDEGSESFDAAVSADALGRAIDFLDRCFGEVTTA